MKRPAPVKNAVAKELRTPKYRARVVRNKKAYVRKGAIRAESDTK
ncbi:hypothetical protein SAMN05519103_03933 [Rhizobiales bacterium GAS113]|nr:hypothetical protein SAMN05519103_03933 [Rhizobiales bacterium GAS113]